MKRWLITDGDYGSLENLLGKEGILKPQAQKSFLYLCYRQQFLEFIENSTFLSFVQETKTRRVTDAM
jgi:hypothetical protein